VIAKESAIMRYISIVVGAFLLFFLSNGCARASQDRVCFKNQCIYVELARTDAEKMKGLMHRDRLDSDRGMLFVYDREVERAFYMKNMLIPLDMVWINKDKEVVFISEDIQPCMADPCPIIRPGVKIKYVLEINARRAKAMGLSIGDKLEINID